VQDGKQTLQTLSAQSTSASTFHFGVGRKEMPPEAMWVAIDGLLEIGIGNACAKSGFESRAMVGS